MNRPGFCATPMFSSLLHTYVRPCIVLLSATFVTSHRKASEDEAESDFNRIGTCHDAVTLQPRSRRSVRAGSCFAIVLRVPGWAATSASNISRSNRLVISLSTIRASTLGGSASNW